MENTLRWRFPTTIVISVRVVPLPPPPPAAARRAPPAAAAPAPSPLVPLTLLALGLAAVVAPERSRG